MHLILILIISITTALAAQDVQEEALFVRRIIEFWKDRETPLVVAQIQQFIQTYPNSLYKDSLLVILGDIYWDQGNYGQALDTYDSIQAAHFREKVWNNRIDCLYRLAKYGQVMQETESKLPQNHQLPPTTDQALCMYYFAEAKFATGNPEEATPLYKILCDSGSRYAEASAQRLASLLRQSENKGSEDFAKGLTITETLLAAPSTSDENRESLEFDRASLLYALHRWKDSREAFLAFIERYPETPLSLRALPYLANASQQLLEEAERRGENLQSLQEQLRQDLLLVLKTPQAIPTAEMPKYYLKLAKVSYDLEHYEAARDLMDIYVKEYPEDPFLDQCYYLLALCNQNLNDHPRFIDAAETVLRLNPEGPEVDQVRVNLFNAYLHQSKTNGVDTESLIDKAAEHLFQVMLAGKEEIKRENLLWLAYIYYDKAQEGRYDAFAQRATLAFEKALDSSSINSTNEHAFFKWSKVKGWLGRKDQQMDLLKKLMAYKTADPKLGLGVKLEWVRLSFESLPEEKRSMEDPDMLALLKTLKDLQIKKVLAQEPIHLEAALDYVRFRSSLEPPEKRDEQQHFLLLRIKEEFSSKKDLWGKEYHASRQQYPDKELIYQAYLMLIDARLLQLEANQGHTPEHTAKREAAQSIYKSLLHGKFAVSKYLVDQAQSALEPQTGHAQF